jgi:hypothetical protein
MVPVPSFEKLWFRFLLSKVTVKVTVPVPAPYLDHKKLIFQKNFGKLLVFLHTGSKLFYKEKNYKFQQIFCKI